MVEESSPETVIALYIREWVRWWLMVALRRDIRIGPVHSRFQVFDPLSLRF